MKKIKEFLIMIIMLIGYVLFETIQWLPWLSIFILFGCLLYLFVTPIAAWIIWTMLIIFIICKTWVDIESK